MYFVIVLEGLTFWLVYASAVSASVSAVCLSRQLRVPYDMNGNLLYLLLFTPSTFRRSVDHWPIFAPHVSVGLIVLQLLRGYWLFFSRFHSYLFGGKSTQCFSWHLMELR